MVTRLGKTMLLDAVHRSAALRRRDLLQRQQRADART
jgi:hypothetical protein